MNAITSKYWQPIKTTESDFKVKFDMNRSEEFKYCLVTTASIPKSYYALPADSKVTVQTDLWTETVTMPKANYNPISFSLYFTNRLAALGRTVTVHYPDKTIEPDTNKFTMTFSGVASVSLSCDSIYLAHMCGIAAANEVVASSSNVWVSPQCLDYQSHNKIIIQSNIVANQKQNFQEIVSNGVPYNAAISYVCPSLTAHFRILNRLDSDTYDFTLRDELGNKIDFNGAEVHFTVCVFNSTHLDEYIKRDIENRNKVLMDQLESWQQINEPTEG